MKVIIVLLVTLLQSAYGHHDFSYYTDPCPSFIDHSAGFHLSSNSTGYPSAAINDEILAKSPEFDCELSGIAQPITAVPEDSTLTFSRASCPSVSYQLWSFYRNGAKCWLVDELQHPVHFTICSTTRCQVCGDDPFSNNGRESRCIPRFEYHSLWAFCDDLIPGDQIRRERVILPVSCSCLKIQCNNYPWWWKR